MLFFVNASDTRYGTYMQECHNAFSKGHDDYPETISDAHMILEEYQNPHRSGYSRGGSQSGFHFTQNRNGEREFHCYNCGRKNECISTNCTHVKREDGTPTRDELRRRNREQETGENHVMDSEVISGDETSDYNSVGDDTSSEDEIDDVTVNGPTDDEEIDDDLDDDDYVYSFNQYGRGTRGTGGCGGSERKRRTCIQPTIKRDNHRYMDPIGQLFNGEHFQ